MKTLFLGRHAKSSWETDVDSDYNRPLNDRGERNAPEMGQRLATKYPPPDHFAASPALRAQATAEILAMEWGFFGEIEWRSDFYESTTYHLLDVIHTFDDAHASAAIVAHNPTITHLANLLGNLPIPNVPTCGIVVLKGPASWKDFEPRSANTLEFDFPKNKPN